ncbi:hypothetical protein [Streptomyces cuspidosporus]|uniref:Methyltransferase n=1 Tax=Streptomyces cuspidosporus TaxID=66882 RepID=A0ABN3FDW4_9ACTN
MGQPVRRVGGQAEGEDDGRALVERVEAFAPRYTDKLSVFDTAAFELPGVSGRTRSLISPVLLATAFERVSAHLVFVDLYFLRKIVRPGGLIVVDDDWAPSVRTAVRYYEQNLGWTGIPGAFPGETATAVGSGPRDEPRIRCKALRLPDPSSEPPFEDFHAF